MNVNIRNWKEKTNNSFLFKQIVYLVGGFNPFEKY